MIKLLSRFFRCVFYVRTLVCVRDPSVCVYMILSCMWKCLFAFEVLLAVKFLYGRLCGCWIVLLITFKPIISLFDRRKWPTKTHNTSTTWFGSRLMDDLIILEQKTRSHVDSFPFPFLVHLHNLCIYIFMPAMKFWPPFVTLAPDRELAQTSPTYSAM